VIWLSFVKQSTSLEILPSPLILLLFEDFDRNTIFEEPSEQSNEQKIKLTKFYGKKVYKIFKIIEFNTRCQSEDQ
jgi:hypothetical protein